MVASDAILRACAEQQTRPWTRGDVPGGWTLFSDEYVSCMGCTALRLSYLHPARCLCIQLILAKQMA